MNFWTQFSLDVAEPACNLQWRMSLVEPARVVRGRRTRRGRLTDRGGAFDGFDGSRGFVMWV